MELTKLLDSVNDSKQFPLKEINALIENKEKSLSILLELLKSVSINYKRIDLNRLDYIAACYILSEWREKKAFPYLLKLVSIPSDWANRIWGDVMTESLTRFLVSTFDGNIQSLKQLIENEAVNPYCRAALIDTLVGLVAEGILSREEVLRYFKTLMTSDLVYDYEFSGFIIESVYKLYPQELYQEIVDLFNRNLADPSYISKEEIDVALSKSKDDWLKTHLYGYKNHLPIDNAIEAMSWLDFEAVEESACDMPIKTKTEHAKCC